MPGSLNTHCCGWWEWICYRVKGVVMECHTPWASLDIRYRRGEALTGHAFLFMFSYSHLVSKHLMGGFEVWLIFQSRFSRTWIPTLNLHSDQTPCDLGTRRCCHIKGSWRIVDIFWNLNNRHLQEWWFVPPVISLVCLLGVCWNG